MLTDGETKHGENYEESDKQPAPTKYTVAGGKKESELSSDVQQMVTIAKVKKNLTCGVGH